MAIKIVPFRDEAAAGLGRGKREASRAITAFAGLYSCQQLFDRNLLFPFSFYLS